MSRIKYGEFKSNADLVLNFLRDELKKIRSGRAHPSIVEDLDVSAYGSRQPLKNIANINVIDSHLLGIQPWDKSLVHDIVKSLQESSLGLNPVVLGDMLKLPLPPLTEERRREYVKVMKDKLEEAKIAIRNLRKDVLNGLNQEKAEGVVTEDELKRFEKDIQKMVDEANSAIEETGKKKEEELLTV